MAELQVVLEGAFEKRRILDLLRFFIVFEDEGAGKLTKKMAGYHQFHAVNVAVEETLRAAKAREGGTADHRPGGNPGDRRVGVVWHTQGSGKSLTMAFYAGRVILHPEMENPTVVPASDPLDWQPHIRNKPRRELLAQRFRDAKDPFKMVIVRDMWLTGDDAPSLHTMYVDKPMRGHGLMEAIARVNRVFKDKPGGLVVDYLGLADELRQPLATYTESGGVGKTAIDQAEAVALMLEKHEVCRGLLHGFDWSRWITGTPQEHVLALEDGKNRLLHAVTELSQAFALSVPHGRSHPDPQ